MNTKKIVKKITRVKFNKCNKISFKYKSTKNDKYSWRKKMEISKQTFNRKIYSTISSIFTHFFHSLTHFTFDSLRVKILFHTND